MNFYITISGLIRDNLGADIIECDVGVTKDKELVCLHDAYLSRTTNIETIPKFSDRKQWRKYEGVPYNDWWVVDFTLEELKDGLRPIIDYNS